MKILDILTEDVNSNIVYHNFESTNRRVEQNLISYARGGALIARTKNRINNLTNTKFDGGYENFDDDEQKKGRVELGTSFTRSRQFALNQMEFGDISLVVDLDKIKQTNKVVPIDDLVDAKREAPTAGRRTNTAYNLGRREEEEEFVLGDIKEFARCIRAIHVNYKNRSADDDPDRKKQVKKLQETISLLTRNYPHIKVHDKGEALNLKKRSTGYDDMHTYAKVKEKVVALDKKYPNLDRIQSLFSQLNTLKNKIESDKQEDIKYEIYTIEQEVKYIYDNIETITRIDAVKKSKNGKI